MMNNEATMTVLVVEPGKKPYTKQIPASNDMRLEALQHEVHGYIQCIYPFEDPVAILCDDEGKLKGYPLNRALRDDAGEIYDILTGTFLDVQLTRDSFCSLSDEFLKKYEEFFRYPEIFYWENDTIVALSIRQENM